MQLRGCAVKWVAGAKAPAGFKAEESEVDATLDHDSAAAIPSAVLSLLYPDQRDVVALTRLSGFTPDSEWRVSLEVGKRRFRVTRNYSWSSVALEAQDPVTNDWGVVARGGDQCRAMLGRIFPIAPPEVVSALCFAVNPTKPLQSLDPEREVSRIELLSNSAMMGFGDGKPSTGGMALDDFDRLRVAQQFQQSATWDMLSDQIRILSQRLGDVMSEMGGLVDDTGELARVSKALSENPRMRPITTSERDALRDTDARRLEFDRRIAQANDELDGANKDLRRGAWYRNAPLLLGVLAGLAITFHSLTQGVHARKFALGNIVFFGVALVGALRYIGALEQNASSGRRRATVERRLAQLTEERDQLDAIFAKVSRELSVRTAVEYEERVERRKKLEERERMLTEANRDALDKPQYVALEQQKRRIDVELAERRAALTSLHEGTEPNESIGKTLRSAGWDPAVALWEPRNPNEALAAAASEVIAVAATYGQVVDGALAPGLQESWARLARHVTCEGLEGLAVRGSQIVSTEREDLVRSMPSERAWVLVESLRLSVLLALRSAGVEGIPDFIVRVHAFRFDDPMVETHLRGVYSKLSGRFQVVCIEGR